MATQADVRRIALALPDVEEGSERFAFSVKATPKPKGFAWVWMERIDPKKARVPNPEVLAVRVASLTEKDLMIAADPAKFFTEPHYNGFPAVLVRLKAIRVPELRAILRDAWKTQAPKALLASAATPGRGTSAAPTTRGSRARSAPAPRGRSTGGRSSPRS